jgi:hypothetical protein
MEDEGLTSLQTRVDKLFFSTKSQHYRVPHFSKHGGALKGIMIETLLAKTIEIVNRVD